MTLMVKELTRKGKKQQPGKKVRETRVSGEQTN